MSTDDSPPTGTARPRRISVDFWRGVALLTIFINHIPGNTFTWLTHRNVGFSDATEVFVMLAGVAAAFAYLTRFRDGRAAPATFRILQRAFQIYMAHIVLIVFCGAVVAYASTQTGDMRFLEMFRLDVLVNDTIPGLIGLATLSLQPSYLDILPLYVVLLAAAPALLWMVARSLRLALAVSGAVYLIANLFHLDPLTYPAPGNWFLNPLCWQFLFVVGLCIGAGLMDERPFPRSRLLLGLSLGYLALAAWWTVTGFWPGWDLSPLPLFIWDFNKTDLHLPRLLHVLALGYVVSHGVVELRLQGLPAVRRIAVLGRHSLPVFALGTVLAVIGQVLRAISGGGLAVDIALVGTGIVLLFACAGVLEWNRIGQASFRGGAGPAQAR
jgi:hypothetical protein